jgi:hypothetical protein
MIVMYNAASPIAVLPIHLCDTRLVRSEKPSNFVTILNRGPQRRGMRLITDMVAARVPIPAHVAFGIVTKSTFTMKYKVVAVIWNLVAVPVKEVLGSRCGYTACFKIKNEIDSHFAVITR